VYLQVLPSRFFAEFRQVFINSVANVFFLPDFLKITQEKILIDLVIKNYQTSHQTSLLAKKMLRVKSPGSSASYYSRTRYSAALIIA
jgi:hypothetical protein